MWQPEIVRSRQNRIVEQSDIPAEYRINALEMELRLCKIQITDYHNALVSLYAFIHDIYRLVMW